MCRIAPKALSCFIVVLFCIRSITYYNSFSSHRRTQAINPSVPSVHPVSSKCLFSTSNFAGIKVFSQNDEDGILLHILRCMGGHGKKEYFEFGANDGDVVNTRILREHYGWKGHMLDGGYEKPEINLHREWFTPTNIVQLFEKYQVSKTIDVLSIDADCDDFWISREILRAGYRPRILIIEYNANVPSYLPLTVAPKEIGRESEEFCRGCYFGSGASALNKLARAFGYILVYSNHVNLFFVQYEQAKNIGLAIPSFIDVVPPLEKKLNAALQGTKCTKEDEAYPMLNHWVYVDDKTIARCHHPQINHRTLKSLVSNSTVTYEITEENNEYRFFKNE